MTIDALLRIEGSEFCPGKGWELVNNTNDFWILEIPSGSGIKEFIEEAFEDIQVKYQRAILYLSLYEEGGMVNPPYLLDLELVALLCNKNIELEIWSAK